MMRERTGTRLRGVAAAVLAATVAGGVLRAQGRPRAEVSAVADADGVRVGSTLRVALQVRLPDGVHVQSNAPRDPLLIGTAVTVQAPPGVSVVETVYPPATDFKQAGQSVPLLVFEQRFVVGVKLAIAPTVDPGALSVPIRLRYQACNDTTCFAPAREEVSLPVRVVARTATVLPQQRELFDVLRFTR